MYFAGSIYALVGFAAGLITGLILYHLISRKFYGNMENRFKSSLHDFLETENKNLLNTSTVAFKNALETEKSERENTGLRLNGLIDPLRDSLRKYQSYIENVENERKMETGALKDNLDTLSKKITDLEHDTIKLSGALKNPSIRGKWGEITLRRTVEIAGMTPYCDFIEQAVSEDKSKPDMIIRLPNKRNIVVDSKVPLSGFFESQDDDNNSGQIERYLSAFNSHIRELASKKYWEKFDGSVDFVVMFLPIESLLSTVMSSKPELIEDAISKRIIVATPVTLISLLLTVHMGWKDINTVENFNELTMKIKDFYNSIEIFASDFNETSKNFSRTIDSFNRMTGDIEKKLEPIMEDLIKTDMVTNKNPVNLREVDRNPGEINNHLK
jgi:DNA recombination protein RmuC